MRVTSDKQTLILAGESPPRRGSAAADPSPGAGSQLQRLTIIATRADDTTVFVQGEYAANAPAPRDTWQSATILVASSPFEPQATPLLPAPYTAGLPVLAGAPASSGLPATSTRDHSSAATQYARTRDLPFAGARASLIDTYA